MRTGIWIPEWINALGLKGNMKLLYAEIVSLSKNGCFASNQHFAEVLGLKQDTVSRMISTLKKNGFVMQSSFDGRKRTLVPLRLKSSNTELEKTPMQNRNQVQSRVGEASNRVLDFPSKPCTIVQRKKEEIKVYNHKTWEGFLEFGKKLSISTFEKIQKFTDPDSLPQELRVYYDRFLNVA